MMTKSTARAALFGAVLAASLPARASDRWLTVTLATIEAGSIADTAGVVKTFERRLIPSGASVSYSYRDPTNEHENLIALKLAERRERPFGVRLDLSWRDLTTGKVVTTESGIGVDGSFSLVLYHLPSSGKVVMLRLEPTFEDAVDAPAY